MPSVADRLRERITSQGPIPFAVFMEEALYGEGGYYARTDLAVGVEGDFVTGSSLSPLLGQTTARLMGRLDGILGQPADYLEVGYGNASHLKSVLGVLNDGQPRRVLAADRFPRPVPIGVEIVEDLEQIEPRSLRGLVFSYELFDALPVHRLIARADGVLGELWVELVPDGSFRYVERGLSDPSLVDLLGEMATDLLPGQIADVSPGCRDLYRQLAERLHQGLVVTCDYGFERQRLFDPRVRLHGTVACYRRHRVHRNALAAVGEQDITAHVDFTALREEGEEAGLETLALSRQARWLLVCGIFDELQHADQATRLEAMTLLDSGGMGEEIRVLVQARGIRSDQLFAPELL